MKSFEAEYLSVIIEQFRFLKNRAEQGIAQLTAEELHWRPSEESNNMAILIKHISGSAHSKWADFLVSDGEKSFRKRDFEFIDEGDEKEQLMETWEKGWNLLFTEIEHLNEEDLIKTVSLRGEPLSVVKAIQLELAHINYHVGQILFLGKQIKDKEWEILSTPKNTSVNWRKE